MSICLSKSLGRHYLDVDGTRREVEPEELVALLYEIADAVLPSVTVETRDDPYPGATSYKVVSCGGHSTGLEVMTKSVCESEAAIGLYLLRTGMAL